MNLVGLGLRPLRLALCNCDLQQILDARGRIEEALRVDGNGLRCRSCTDLTYPSLCAYIHIVIHTHILFASLSIYVYVHTYDLAWRYVFPGPQRTSNWNSVGLVLPGTFAFTYVLHNSPAPNSPEQVTLWDFGPQHREYIYIWSPWEWVLLPGHLKVKRAGEAVP